MAGSGQVNIRIGFFFFVVEKTIGNKLIKMANYHYFPNLFWSYI